MHSDADLELEAWREAMAGLVLACAQARGHEAGELVLSLHTLLAHAPRGHGWALPARGAIEDWLAARAEIAAVLAMIEHQAGYMLSHGPGGDHMATVAFPVTGVESSAEATHGAIALIGAIAGALAGPVLEHGAVAHPAAHPSLRLN